MDELEKIGVSFLIVCGEIFDHPNVVYRRNGGKWDAINYGASFIPKETQVIVLNDVDTQICNFIEAFKHLNPFPWVLFIVKSEYQKDLK